MVLDDCRPGKDCGAGSARKFQHLVGGQVRSESNRGAAGIELQRKRPTPSRHVRCSRLQWINFVSDFVGDQLGGPTRWSILRTESWATAPVSHQKRHERSATNAIEIERKRREFNEADRYSAAHNGLVAGSSPAGPTPLRPSGYAWRSHAETEGWSVSGVAGAQRKRRRTGPASYASRPTMMAGRRPRDGAGLAPNQNIENNPMQRSKPVAGWDAPSDPAKTF